MGEYPMKVGIRRLPKDPNTFEFVIITPTIKTQFLLPRKTVNELRIAIEKALTTKPR